MRATHWRVWASTRAAREPWLEGVADPYETSASDWKLSLGFGAAAARLRGLFKGSFRGIEVLSRGVSPRIVSAEVLGSAGGETVSGPELAARLGLSSTWAYFSVKTGAILRAEPDRSGRAPAPAPPGSTPAPSTPAPAAAPAPASPQGGAPAPGASVSTAGTGGAAA